MLCRAYLKAFDYAVLYNDCRILWDVLGLIALVFDFVDIWYCSSELIHIPSSQCFDKSY
jgi:hypothetical protein